MYVRDLFFSGHTATTFLAFVATRRQHAAWKALFFGLFAATAAMVLVQKTHYTIDVFAAPFFVYTINSVVREARKWGHALYMATPVASKCSCVKATLMMEQPARNDGKMTRHL